MTNQANVNDVEKRWHDPRTTRAAITYVLSVVALAGLAFAATAVWQSLLAAVLVPGILCVGGLGGLVQTYRVWRAGGVWPIWQAVSWFLLLFFMFCLGIPFSVQESLNSAGAPAILIG
ncbi:MAG: hypothetical protein FGM25_13905 [Mycobacterium sp.]|nr:hypothetical protein [Mycobacterium sp.]